MSTCCSEVVKVGEANNFESVRGEPYSVTVDQLPRVAGKNGGLSVEFRSCVRTKTRRASLVLATLGFLDLAVSFLLVRVSIDQRVLLVSSLWFYCVGRVQYVSGSVCLPHDSLPLHPLLPRSLHI